MFNQLNGVVMYNLESFQDRLVFAMKDKGFKQIDLVNEINISKGTASNWYSGKTAPESPEQLVKLTKFLGVNMEWLVSGIGPMRNDVQFPSKNIAVWSDDDILPNGVVAIDFMPSVRASLGGGRINDEYGESEKLWFREQTLRDCNVNAEQSVAILVEGDSMLPELADGQAIAIDRSATKIFDGEIYAFRIGDELKVKYLFRHQDGFKAVSRNEDKLRFPDEFYTSQDIETKDIEILGQFWWKSATRRVRR